jgi:hypothetical protein
MAVVGLAAGTVVAGMPVLRAMAMATDTRPTGPCMATIGLTGATGIGITKQIAKVVSAHQSGDGQLAFLEDHLQ